MNDCDNYTKSELRYAVILQEKDGTDIRRLSRRVSRVSTLDGGSVVTDSGYTDTDRTLVIVAEVTEAQDAMLETMIKNFALLTVSTRAGCFACAPGDFTLGDGEVRLNILVAE